MFTWTKASKHETRLNFKIIISFAGPVEIITINEIDIYWVRYHFHVSTSQLYGRKMDCMIDRDVISRK